MVNPKYTKREREQHVGSCLMFRLNWPRDGRALKPLGCTWDFPQFDTHTDTHALVESIIHH